MPSGPGRAAGDQAPSRAAQGRAAHARLGKGDQALVTEGFCRAPRCSVQHRVGVACAVAGGPGDFEGGAVIKVAGNRPADDSHGAQRAGLLAAPTAKI